MKHFLIYTNRLKDKDLSTTKRICDYLEIKGQRVTVKADGDCRLGNTDEIPADIPLDVDCMIVLGGDGTVLRAARETKKLHIPIIGVNLGTLGYMTEIEPINLEESLDRLIGGDYEQENRMMLNGRVLFADGRSEEGWALNDIVISRSGSLQIIKFNIYVNGQFLNNYSADGMIVTTPTGSTGYNMSAGGPIVEPGAKLFVLTPICAHTLNARSIILKSEDIVEIEIDSGHNGTMLQVEANSDGNERISMKTGDKIFISKADSTTKIIKLSKESFLEILHKKM